MMLSWFIIVLFILFSFPIFAGNPLVRSLMYEGDVYQDQGFFEVAKESYDQALEMASQEDRYLIQKRLRMVNRKIEATKKNNKGQASFDLFYDSNVNQVNPNSSTVASKEASPGGRLSVDYATGLGGASSSWSMATQLDHTYYSQQSVPSVKQNDSLHGLLAFSYSSVYDTEASRNIFVITPSFEYQAQDNEADGQYSYYSSAYSISGGHYFQGSGKSMPYYSLRYQKYNSYQESQNQNVISISAGTQLKSESFAATLSADASLFQAVVATDDSRLYSLQSSLSFLEFFKSTDLGFLMAIQVLDTMAQKATRGSEVSYVPSLELSKRTSNRWRWTFQTTYKKHTSKDTNYQYDQMLVQLGAKYAF